MPNQIKLLVAVTLVTVAAIHGAARFDNQPTALETCQARGFSFATCHHSLNR